MVASGPNSKHGSDPAQIDESTALLASGSATNGDIRKADRPNGSSPEDNAGDDTDDKPLDKTQVLLLCYVRVVEPLAFFSIFPYISQMVQQNAGVSESDVGFYSGLIESLFSLTQAIVMVFWGKASDRIGRKPVLTASLCGVTVATGLFGFAKTIPQMILFRCLAGVFAGTIVTIRTMIAEHSTSKTQARAFSWFAFGGNLGIFFGPLLGGALADPIRQYPRLFGSVELFKRFPYALSSLTVAGIAASAALSCGLFVRETLVKEPDVTSESNEEVGAQNPVHRSDLSTWQLLKSPGVGIVLYVYGHVMVLANAFTAIIPVFWYTSPPLGGYGFSLRQISLMMCLNGFAQASWLLFIFPPMVQRFGSDGVMRICGYAYPIFFLACPIGTMLLRADTETSRAVFWVFAPTALAMGSGVAMSFTAIQLALNDISPSPRVLSTLNAIALTGASCLRAFNPALFNSLFAVGARTQFLGGYAIWILMILIAAGLPLAAQYLPESLQARDRRIKRESRDE